MSVTESQFNMWRTLFALAHADHIVTPEEVRFMAEALEDVPFSQIQHDRLIEDAKAPQDVEGLFMKITDVRDQAEFFSFADTLVYVDGDFGAEEQEVMARLRVLHARHPDLYSLGDGVDVSLEGHEEDHESPFKRVFVSFRNWFLNEKID